MTILVYNGTGGASYEWYWEGYDGSLNTNTSNLGPNLLGAELLLDFPMKITNHYQHKR